MGAADESIQQAIELLAQRRIFSHICREDRLTKQLFKEALQLKFLKDYSFIPDDLVKMELVSEADFTKQGRIGSQ